MEHDLHQPATPEEIWTILREVSKQQAETDRRREKDRQDARKRMNRLEELFTGQWGKLLESLVEGDLVELLRARGIDITSTLPNGVKGRRNGEHYQFDLVVKNGEELVVVEVKTTMTVDDVKHFLGKMNRFTEFEPVYQGLRIYGAVAYLKVVQEAELYAARQGLFVIRATGSSASIINDEDFRPKRFC